MIARRILMAIEEASGSHADYASIDAINWSTLKEAARSALHYQYRLAHPAEETAAMRFGRAVHTAVFEPDRFPLEYVVFDGAARRGKDWEAFVAANANRTILRRDEYEKALAIRDAVRANKPAARLLRRGVAEATLSWTDPSTGLGCKGRIDFLGSRVAVELKTTQTVEARLFNSVAARMLYHCQLAFYDMGLRANGIEVQWKLIAIEAEPPHDVAVFAVGDDVLQTGAEQCRELLALVARCRSSRRQRWPGRYQEEQTLRLPTWALPDEADEFVLMGLAPAKGAA